VDIVEENGALRRLAAAHVDPRKEDLLHELHRRYPPNQSVPYGILEVLRSGQAEFVPEVSDLLMEAITSDPEHLRITKELGMKSYMIVPLRARGRTLGAITFVWANPNHSYGPADLALAENRAHRAGLAVD